MKHEPVLLRPCTITEDMLTKSQRKALSEIEDWYYSKKSRKEQIFRLGGPAGTGKTYLIQYFLSTLNLSTSECYVVAYTGQAVNVLRQNGIYAKTIHSTFMELYQTIYFKDGEPVIHRGVPVMINKFRPRKSIPSAVQLIICDEASFLPKDLEDIIRRYDVPILEIGDPLQLPPVSGKQCFHMKNLDYILTDIVRQDKDSEIIDLATRFRNGLDIPLDQYSHGEVRFLYEQKDIEDTFYHFLPLYKHSDRIITVTNKTRSAITKLYRDVIVKANSPYPKRGERLICRKNEWNECIGEYPLTNGTQGVAVYTVGKSEVNTTQKLFFLSFRPDFIPEEYYDGLVCDGNFLLDDFTTNHTNLAMKRPGCKFEYAYAITTHLSQGSTYQGILFMDQYMGYLSDEEYAARLRYTAVTRAKKYVNYILPKYNPGYNKNIYKL